MHRTKATKNVTININFSPLRVLFETVSPAALVIINTKLDRLIMTVTERLQAVEKKLDESSREFLAELAKLHEEKLSGDGEATLTRLEAKATAMSEIVPGTSE